MTDGTRRKHEIQRRVRLLDDLDGKTFRKPHIESLAVHSGHQLHRIASTPDPQPGDRRITMQAHAMRVDGTWLMYW